MPLAIEFATAFDPCAIAEDALCTDTLLWTSGNPKHQGPDVVAALLFVCINTCDVLYAFTIPGELVSFTLCNKLKSKVLASALPKVIVKVWPLDDISALAIVLFFNEITLPSG